jgi:hypothetical protein
MQVTLHLTQKDIDNFVKEHMQDRVGEAIRVELKPETIRRYVKSVLKESVEEILTKRYILNDYKLVSLLSGVVKESVEFKKILQVWLKDVLKELEKETKGRLK